MSRAIEHDQSEGPPLRFERRRGLRWSAQGMGSALCLDGDHFGQIHDLSLLDYAPGGIGAVCEHPIEPGTRLSLGFDIPGRLARRGVVRRCWPCGSGYRLAIQFELGLAA